MYDLNSVRAISSVEIAFYQGATRQTVFDIRFSENGTDWVTVFSGRSSGTTTQPERFTTDNAPARFVRIVGHGNTVNDWNSLTEVVINAGATGVVVQRSGVGESMAAGLGAVRYVACGAVHIMVSAGHASEMTLEVYSVDGRLVKRLWQGSSAPSRIAWDLTDSSNSPVANGVYVVSLRSPSAAATTTRSVRIVR